MAAEDEAWHSIVTLADTVTNQELLSLAAPDLLRLPVPIHADAAAP